MQNNDMKTTGCKCVCHYAKEEDLKPWGIVQLPFPVNEALMSCKHCKLTECNCKEKYGSIKIEHGQEITPHVDCEPMTTDWEKDFDKRNIWKIITSNEEHLAVEKISELIAKAKAEGYDREFNKGVAFAFHLCDCEWCHGMAKAYTAKLKDDLEKNA